MREYEIHIIEASGSPVITGEVQLTDTAAIRSARKAAHGRQFEVWRGLECISGLATIPKSTPAIMSAVRSPYGSTDRLKCPKCGSEMNLTRRSPVRPDEPCELQRFSCRDCEHEEERTVDISGTGR